MRYIRIIFVLYLQKKGEGELYDRLERSGQIHEKFLVGYCLTESLSYKNLFHRVARPSGHPKFRFYVSFDNSVELVRRAQSDKPKLFLTQLRQEASSILKMLGYKEEIEVLTAVGTPLDVLHGTDVVVIWGSSQVTIDITLKRGKEFKADILVDQRIPEDKKRRRDFINGLAKEVVKKLMGC